MTKMIPQKGFCKVEEESTYGTDPASDPFGLILTQEPAVTVPDREQINRPRVRPDAGREQHAIVDRQVSFSFQTVVAPIPFADNAQPSLSPIMKGSGFTETLLGSTSSPPVQAKYSVTRESVSSFTLKLYWKDKDAQAWAKHVITGCRSTIDFNLSVGSELIVNVEGMGLMSEVSDFSDVSSDIPSNFHQGETSFHSHNITFKQGGNNKTITDYSIALNAEPTPIEELNDTSIAETIMLNNHSASAPSGSFNPLVESINNSDQYSKMKTASAESLDLSVDSSDGKWEHKCNNTQLTEAVPEEADAYYRYNDSFVVNEDSSKEMWFNWQRSS